MSSPLAIDTTGDYEDNYDEGEGLIVSSLRDVIENGRRESGVNVPIRSMVLNYVDHDGKAGFIELSVGKDEDVSRLIPKEKETEQIKSPFSAKSPSAKAPDTPVSHTTFRSPTRNPMLSPRELQRALRNALSTNTTNEVRISPTIPPVKKDPLSFSTPEKVYIPESPEKRSQSRTGRRLSYTELTTKNKETDIGLGSPTAKAGLRPASPILANEYTGFSQIDRFETDQAKLSRASILAKARDTLARNTLAAPTSESPFLGQIDLLDDEDEVLLATSRSHGRETVESKWPRRKLFSTPTVSTPALSRRSLPTALKNPIDFMNDFYQESFIEKRLEKADFITNLIAKIRELQQTLSTPQTRDYKAQVESIIQELKATVSFAKNPDSTIEGVGAMFKKFLEQGREGAVPFEKNLRRTPRATRLEERVVNDVMRSDAPLRSRETRTSTESSRRTPSSEYWSGAIPRAYGAEFADKRGVITPSISPVEPKPLRRTPSSAASRPSAHLNYTRDPNVPGKFGK